MAVCFDHLMVKIPTPGREEVVAWWGNVRIFGNINVLLFNHHMVKRTIGRNGKAIGGIKRGWCAR